jgi:DNA-binding transcriptional MerR regulator
VQEPAAAPSARDTPRPEIPNRLYFRIGDVSRLAGVKPHVLRFWESEFPAIAPKKSGTGQRLYRRKEVELILEIRDLLYEKRYTIEGARMYLESRRKNQTAAVEAAPAGPTTLADIRRELEALVKLLSR